MKIASVTLTRLGNKYLREYVEYYKKLGVDKMYFYDNNHEDEEPVSAVLQDYVDSNFVEIKKFGNVKGRIQEKAYQDFYINHGEEYDWICVFDDDEYVTFTNGETSLKNFLSNPIFDDKNGVCFPFINFGDSDIIVNEKNTRLDVYTKVAREDDVWCYSYYKTIIRGNLNVNYYRGYYMNKNQETEIYDEHCHVPCVDNKIYNGFVDCDGNEVSTFYTAIATHNAYLKHVPTGCIDDYVNMKMKRKWPDTDYVMKFEYDYFLCFNKHTDEKFNYYWDHIHNT